ncbi:MAG: HEAT repeat domain-containing protein [Pseudomonadota bacterium]
MSMRAWVLGVLLVGVVASCRDHAPTVQIGKILVDASLGDDGVVVDREAVRAALHDQLETAPKKSILHWADDGPGLVRAHVMAGRVPPDAHGRPVLVMRLQLDAPAASGGRLAFEVTSEQRAESADELPQVLLDAAARQAVRKLGRTLALGSAPVPELLEVAAGEDRDLRLRAISVLGERRDVAALEPLIQLLQDKDEAIVLRAVGALVVLGDPRGVSALTDLTHRRNPSFVRQIVYAVAAIGGREAEAYLFIVATGHPDPAVQEAARRAQSELAARPGER